MKAWGVQWHSKNRLDGDMRHLLWSPLFHTRREARLYIDEKFGYIRRRIDLRVEPHGWRMPRAVRVVAALAGEEKCPACGGTGTLGKDPIDWRCKTCGGTGKAALAGEKP